MIHRTPTLIQQPALWRRLFVGVWLMLVMVTAWQFSGPSGHGGELMDFHAFYVAGLQLQQGDVLAAYDAPQTFQMQHQLFGVQSFMPWAYPPAFDLLARGLAELPLSTAYVLWIGMSTALFYISLRRLSHETELVLLLALPAILVCLRCGQSALLVAALMAICVSHWTTKPRLAGAALGLLVIKPHLAIGLGLLAIIRREWSLVFTALASSAVINLLATAVFGLEIWPAFLQGLAQAKAFLEQGAYPLHRMVSAYAMARSLGAEASWALSYQFLCALLAISAQVFAHLKRWSLRQQQALAIVSSAAVSPYFYDYDLTVLAVALALLAASLSAQKAPQLLGLLLLAWLASGWGLIMHTIYGSAAQAAHWPVSWGFAFLVLLAWQLFTKASGRPL